MTSDVTSDAVMALISDQAFTRHQYQRRMNTNPVPAPRPINSFQPCSTLVSMLMTASEQTMSTAVATRDAVIWARGPASGRMKRRYTSFTRYDAPQLRWVLIVLMYAAANAASSSPFAGDGRTSTITRT